MVLVVGLVAAGCFLVFMALEGVREHVLWFSPRLGNFIVVPTASLLLVGGLLILLGIYAWYGRG
jgi:hypothetical protein